MTCFSCKVPMQSVSLRKLQEQDPQACVTAMGLSQQLHVQRNGADVAVHHGPAAVKGLTDVEDVLI